MPAVFTILGILLGTASLASLLQRLLDVGLAPITQQILDYYRWFMTDIVRVWLFDWWTVKWFDWQTPDYLLDAIAIWTLSYSIIWRLYTKGASGYALNWKDYIVALPFAPLVVFAKTMTGFSDVFESREKIYDHYLRSDFVSERPEFEKYYQSVRSRRLRAVSIIIATPASTFAFFAWNAILLSP